MKVFIVSMALIIMGTAALVFGWDANNYAYLQTHLKALCESTAAAAAVCFDADEFENQNDIVYFYGDVYAFANDFVSKAVENMPQFQNGTVTIEELVADSDGDRVAVCISYTSKDDLFRSPFKTQKKLIHFSCYEWISYDQE